jgi:D-alanyl-D-alanine carboxypeptidase
MKPYVLKAALAALAMALAGGQASAAPPSKAEVAREAADLMARNYRPDAPGAAILVARGDTILFRSARGEADLEHHAKLRPDSVFRIGSVTKQFAAAGLLKLVEAGKVRLDDPLSKYVPDFPGGDRITIEQLLNHSAGVKNYTDLPGYMETMVQRDLTTRQMILAFQGAAPDFAPGSNWAYSNSGYVLVGAVIEAASGEPWHAYLQRVLFRPLGMTHTGYGHDPRYAARQVRGYTMEGEKFAPARTLSMTQPHAAGALVSNVDDLLKWNRALHEGRVIRNPTYARMITPAGAATGPGYGFGLFTGKVRTAAMLRHGGAIFGFASSLAYLPGPDISVIVLENDDAGNAPDNAANITRKLAAIALGDPYPAGRPVPVDASALAAAEGVFVFEGGNRRSLRLIDGALTAQRGGGPRLKLIPIGPDDFLYEDGFSRLRLERDSSGAVARIRFFANGDGDGEIGERGAEAAAIVLPRAALERLAGTYAHSGRTMKIWLEGGTLQAQLAGQPPVTLVPNSPTSFDVAETGATLTFPAGDGPAAEAAIRQSGREMVLKRAE